MDVAVAAIAFGFAALAALLFVRNLTKYTPPPFRGAPAGLAGISVLIPARNEERTIRAAVTSVLANEGVQLEVIVLDDQSSDGTGAVLEALAAADARVSVLEGGDLPSGWCGKQYACAKLARHARYPLLCFIDADVWLGPNALARMASFVAVKDVDLASGVPRQETGTFLEKLLIPLIHFVLLAFLPMNRMRRSTHPSYAAGCGQLFVARSDSYNLAGGHTAIRSSMHDGLNLPRAFRSAGLKTDLFDATEIATCRMYHSAGEVWEGLRKNAAEGLGSSRLILPATLLLTMGQLMPFVLVFATEGAARMLSLLAVCLVYVPRLTALARFRQPLVGALLHPLGIVLLLAIQWQARAGKLFGGQVQWKGRAYRSRQPL